MDAANIFEGVRIKNDAGDLIPPTNSAFWLELLNDPRVGSATTVNISPDYRVTCPMNESRQVFTRLTGPYLNGSFEDFPSKELAAAKLAAIYGTHDKLVETLHGGVFGAKPVAPAEPVAETPVAPVAPVEPVEAGGAQDDGGASDGDLAENEAGKADQSETLETVTSADAGGDNGGAVGAAGSEPAPEDSGGAVETGDAGRPEKKRRGRKKKNRGGDAAAVQTVV